MYKLRPAGASVADRTTALAVGAGILSFVAFATSVLTFEEAVVVHLALLLVVVSIDGSDRDV